MLINYTQIIYMSEHTYLSTACYHGDHDYCNSMTGYNGAKRPGQCKFCEAKCVCTCHHRQRADYDNPVEQRAD